MEKVKEIKSRYYIILGLITFTLPAFFVLFEKGEVFKEYIFYFVLFFPVVLLFDKIGNLIHKRDSRLGTAFDHNGIHFNNRLGEDFYIPWEELIIQKRISCAGLFTEFIFKNTKNSIKSNSQVIYWANENSYLELVQKYLPKNHPLHNLVLEHTEKRGIML